MKKETNIRIRIFSRILLFLLLAVAASFLLPSVQFTTYSNFKTGYIAPETITAPYDYEILKSDNDLNREKELIKSKIPPVFDYNDSVNNQLYNKFTTISADYSALSQFNEQFSRYQIQKYSQLQEADSIPGDTLYNSFKKRLNKEESYFSTKYGFGSHELNLDYLKDDKKYNKVRSYLLRCRSLKILNVEKKTIVNYKQSKIRLSGGSFSSRLLAESMDPVEKKEQDIVFLQTNIHPDLNNDTLLFWHALLGHFSRPNIIYNTEKTEQEITRKQNDLPIAKGLVKKGEVIAEKGRIITEDTKDKLNSLEKKEQELLAENQSDISGFFKFYSFKGSFGNILYTLFPFMLLFLMVYYNRKSVFYSNKKLGLLLLLIFFDLFTVFIGQKYISSYNEYLIFLPTTSMLLAIFFDSRIAFFTTVVTALISALIMRYNFSFFYSSVVIGVVSIYTVSRIRDRFSLFLRPFISILGGLTLIAIAQNLHSSGNQDEFLNNLLLAVISSFVAPVLTFALVALIEHYFKLPTDISLLELSDMTHPLLKKLQMEAPATYHHSIVIGNLAEAAAEAVSGNSLLARVGAYYHDIGKTFKPDYFIENQQNKVNKHDKLPPNMSALILANHVKEGLKLAKEHNLPQILCDFIAMHHGTSRMEFFYYKALELAKETGEKVDEALYRYPGPKPNSKETAIMMIADVVEARCRTIDKPDYETYRTAINEIIQKKFQEGELDDCDLKLRDLAKIREAMLPVIMGMYHSRIKYPDQVKPEAKPEPPHKMHIDFPSEEFNKLEINEKE